MRHYIDPLLDLGEALLQVEKPGRYVGGEYGLLAKKNAPFQTIIAFPDLYEIGMSNKALRILYNSLNRIEGISCDRVFPPAPDFEALLRERHIPLYGLETGLVPKDADILMFTMGYELGLTSVLTILDLSGIPLHSGERDENNPIVIMGGPCVSNPLPYSPFADCFWIGEAEAGFFDLVTAERDLKAKGVGRGKILEKISAHPSVWAAGKKEARRAIYSGFGSGKQEAAVFPVPVMKVVQHHGAVEIMRGCPNGCRFCHAGFWYRPMRQKDAALIQEEACAFINNGGYREISLSSLSTGDYRGIGDLVETLNQKYGSRHVSFQLPSLKVSSFSLDLLGKISEVRKSGLTFAVETPEDFGQLSINKKVSLENVTAIIREARAKGWKGVKFYFMIGLPNNTVNEEEAITEFVLSAAKQTGMHFNINLGTFIPKPHTPFQWAGQLSKETALEKLNYIRDRLKPKGHKVGIQDPFISVLEGLISRGDARAGALVEEAWRKGCRLDAWGDYLRKSVWEELLEKNKDLVETFLSSIPVESILPWGFIKSNVDEKFILNEKNKANSGETTSPCSEKCTHHCGVCSKTNRIVENIIRDDAVSNESGKGVTSVNSQPAARKDPATRRVIFSFAKEGPGVFHSHLDLMELFAMAFTRAGIPVVYSAGFNPLPVLEIVSPLAVGISSVNETAAVEIGACIDPRVFVETLNERLAAGIRVNAAMNIYVPSGTKKHSLSAWLWGSVYENLGNQDYVPFKRDKEYRAEKPNWNLKRLAVAAKDPANPESPKPFFEVFSSLYPIHDPAL